MHLLFFYDCLIVCLNNIITAWFLTASLKRTGQLAYVEPRQLTEGVSRASRSCIEGEKGMLNVRDQPAFY